MLISCEAFSLGRMRYTFPGKPVPALATLFASEVRLTHPAFTNQFLRPTSHKKFMRFLQHCLAI